MFREWGSRDIPIRPALEREPVTAPAQLAPDTETRSGILLQERGAFS